MELVQHKICSSAVVQLRLHLYFYLLSCTCYSKNYVMLLLADSNDTKVDQN